MSVYNPPTEYISEFNTSLFTNDTIQITTGGGGTGDLTKAQADTYYLSKINSDTSTSALTTFNGAINVLGDTTIGVRGVSGGILNLYRRMRIWDINNASATYADFYSTGTDMNYTVLNNGGAIETYHRFYTCPSSSSTSNLSFEVGNTNTKINNPLIITSGLTPSSTISQSGDNTLINNDNNSGQIIFNAKSSGGTPLDVLALEQTKITANVPVVYRANALQYTEVNQLAQIMRFINKSISGSINFSCQTAGAVDTTCMSISTQGISLNANTVSQGSTSISSNFFYLATTGGVKNLFTNANNAGLNFSSANSATTFNGISTFNQEVKIPTRLTIGATQYASEVLTIAGTTATLTFPLQETIMLTSTGASIAITLPTITLSRQCGFTFIFTKTASITNSVILTAGGANQIIPYGSISNASPYTTMVAGVTCFHLITLEISTGVFAYREI
jgi:hypothetical protein